MTSTNVLQPPAHIGFVGIGNMGSWMAVFAGMIGVTLFGIFLTPVFFYVIRGLVGLARKPAAAGSPALSLPTA
ncbi:MAG: hypothetical protein ACLP9L_19700 [Thermoguttaceae bacterium]